jgi:hypothetical protein
MGVGGDGVGLVLSAKAELFWSQTVGVSLHFQVSAPSDVLTREGRLVGFKRKKNVREAGENYTIRI